MRAHPIPFLLAGVAAVLSTRSAAAQPARDAAHILDAQTTMASLADARPVATYDMALDRHLGARARLVLADSAGQLVGRMWLVGDLAARPLGVTVDGGDIVLRGDSPRGAVEFVLFRQNAHPQQRTVFGHWTIGAKEGEVRGITKG